MHKTVLWRGTAFVVSVVTASVGLSGLASAQTATIINTGPSSVNRATFESNTTCTFINSNAVNIANDNTQTAQTGDVYASDNTSVGLGWSGWPNLDPATWQAQGSGFADWWTNVQSWLEANGSNSWDIGPANEGWASPGANWADWNPITWQANGQTYDAWYSSVSSYLDANQTTWQNSWPAHNATGSTVTSGNATNRSHNVFNITITNRPVQASRSAGNLQCVPNTTVNTPTSDSQTPNPSATVSTPSSVEANTPSGGRGLGVGSGSGSSIPGYSTSWSGHSSGGATSGTSRQSAPETYAWNGGGRGSGIPSAPSHDYTPASAAISNTGPYSTNTVTSETSSSYSATNTNTISINNSNPQYASTGNVYAYNNTSVGADSGSAHNDGGNSFALALAN